MTAPVVNTIHSQVLDVSSTTGFPGTAQVILTTIPAKPFVRWLLMLEHASASVDVSFDGTNIHHTLTGGFPSAGIKIEQPFTQLWVQCAAGGTAVKLRVTAEAPW